MEEYIGFVGNTKGVLNETGRRNGLSCLYNSDKWEFGRKTYRRRSWKDYRKTQYKVK